MGFFSPNGSANRYVGIWYSNVPTNNILWVANRKNPILDSSGVMTISGDGNLVVVNGKRELVWSSNVSNSVTDAKAQLSDSGNLVLLKQSSNSSVNGAEILWESFQHMTDSFLAKMKLSTNSTTNEKKALTSWKSPSDPSIGSFLASLDPGGIPELFIWNGSSLYWRSGPWNAYAYDSGVGCMYWSGDVIDLQKFSVGGATLYIRLALSELDKKRHLREIIATTVIIGTLIVIITIWFARRRVKNEVTIKESKEIYLSNGETPLAVSSEEMLGENLSRVKFQEFVLYKIEELAATTGNFGDANKLGRGGFGPVYKGTLPNGQEIAIKRLSRASGRAARLCE
ncbi:hypothetical protein NL676_013029 [Syzygium grande]|nr:hypothetical protein NL676_013029 [Syzygium grande]